MELSRDDPTEDPTQATMDAWNEEFWHRWRTGGFYARNLGEAAQAFAHEIAHRAPPRPSHLGHTPTEERRR
jgi:hypothetical protein